MRLDSIQIRNFKGISDSQSFEIKPITLFIGPNSSGKSSVIHALAALAQTFKLPNDTRPLILDDELADVHLGRFIEVIHSRKYEDSIGIEFKISDFSLPRFNDGKPHFIDVDLEVSIEFKSTVRTQDVFINCVKFQFQGNEVIFERKKNSKYHAQINGSLIGKGLTMNGIFLDDISFFYCSSSDKSGILQSLFFGGRHISEIFQQVRYLGPFRQSPKRRYPTRGSSPVEVGAEGEAAITMLANEVVQRRRRVHLDEISKWMGEMDLGKKISIQRLSGSDLFDAKVQLEDGEKFSIADLGYGISQILPVLTQCSFAEEGNILLFEQPELHLHTLPAAKLASVFVDVSKRKNLNIVAETHSPQFFKRFITEMRNGNLSTDDFVAYRVTRTNKESCFTRLEVDDDGEIYDNWESGLSLP